SLAVGNVDIFSNVPVNENSLIDPFITVRYYSTARGRPPHIRFEKSRPVLHQILRDANCTIEHRSVIESCIQALSNTQRVDPSPAILREYSQAQTVRRMGERGENFA